MFEKEKIDSISAVGIIVKASDPSQIFLEVKDDGYPRVVFRRTLCFIGGNWIGENAKNDKNTFETFTQEVNEELTLTGALATAVESEALHEVKAVAYTTPRNPIEPTPEDLESLTHLKSVMVSRVRLFGDFIKRVPKAVFEKGNPGKYGDAKDLCSYFEVRLGDEDWEELVRLQNKYGNLSNESLSLITSLDQILQSELTACWGHGLVLQRYWVGKYGLLFAKELKQIEGISIEQVGMPETTYQAYLDRYDIQKKPTL